MTGNIVKLLSEAKTYFWALRHCQRRDLAAGKIQEIKDALAADGIDLSTLAVLRQLESSIARAPYPSVQRASYKEFYFFPIPAFNIEIFFMTMICEQGVELGVELFPGKVDWQFGHDEIQYCIGGDVKVEMIHSNNEERTCQVRVGDVVAVANGTNFITYSTEEGGKFGHAHIFLCNAGGQFGQTFYDVGGMLKLQTLGMIEPGPQGAFPFSDITDRIEVKNWSDLLTVHKDRERDLPTWLRNGWKRREESRALDYAEGTKRTVVTSPDRKPDDFIEWGKGKRQCFVNPLIAEQTAAITDCRFPAGYKRLHPQKEVWVVLKGEAKVRQSIPPLHSEWVDIDLKAHDGMVAANGAHFQVLEATGDFIVRRLAETCAHNNHADMMELKLELDGVSSNV